MKVAKLLYIFVILAVATLAISMSTAMAQNKKSRGAAQQGSAETNQACLARLKAQGYIRNATWRCVTPGWH